MGGVSPVEAEVVASLSRGTLAPISGHKCLQSSALFSKITVDVRCLIPSFWIFLASIRVSKIKICTQGHQMLMSSNGSVSKH